MISILQMRAARALLGWKQSDLSKRSGYSLTALNNIERGAVSPRSNTLSVLEKTFEKAGIEFLENDGVCLSPEKFSIQTLTGKDSVMGLYRDVIETLREVGGEAVWGGMDEFSFINQYRDETFWYYEQMLRHNLKERALCHSLGLRYAPRKTTQYRLLPKEYFGAVNYGIYGNKYVMSTFSKNPRTIIIKHESIAALHKQNFEYFWKLGKPIQFTACQFDDDLKNKGDKIR